MWEEQLFVSLMEDLEGMTLSQEEDRWRSNLDDFDSFSVKSAYLKLEGLVLREYLWQEDQKRLFANMWNSPATTRKTANCDTSSATLTL